MSELSKIDINDVEYGFKDVKAREDANKAYVKPNSGIPLSDINPSNIDNSPVHSSPNLVKSGGVHNELALGAVYDVSAKNPTAGPNNDGKFTLEYILNQNNVNTLIPTSVRRGGMSIKFVQSSDNKYVQFRCMAQNFTTDITQWQGADDEPTVGSNNLVKSGGVYKIVGNPIINSATGANNQVICRINIYLEQGDCAFCELVSDNDALTCAVRAHYTDNTYNTLSSEAATGFKGFLICEKDVDYIESARYNDQKANSSTVTLTVTTAIYAMFKNLENALSQVPLDSISSAFADSKICFNGRKAPEFSADIQGNYTITLYTTLSDNKYVGYYFLPNGKYKLLSVQTNGGQTYSVGRIQNLVADINTGEISVVEERGIQNNHVLLFRPVKESSTYAIGPLAVILDKQNLTQYKSEVKEEFGNKYMVSASSSGTSIQAKITKDFYKGTKLFINVDNSNPETALYVRLRIKDSADFTLLTNSNFDNFRQTIVLTEDYQYIEAVNFVTTKPNTTVDLTVVTGVTGDITKNEKDIDEINKHIDIIEDNQAKIFLPDYYNNYIKERTETIRNDLLSTNGESVRFAFSTDAHWYSNSKKSPQIMSELMKAGLTKLIIFGGDVCSATTPEGQNPVQLDEITQQLRYNGFACDYGTVLCARGNHDFNGSYNTIPGGQPGSDYHSWSLPVTRSLILGSLIDAHYNNADSDCVYYYVDDDVRQIRIFVLFAIENTGQFSSAQEQWFIDNVSNIPSGYDIIIVNHDNCEPTVGLQCPTAYPDVKQLVDAINLKTSGTTTTNSKAFDFTSLTAKVLLFVSGHTHHDLQTFNNECVYICTRADARYSSLAFLGENEFTRESGTISEQAVDFVTIDKGNGDVVCRRIGCGADRIFRTQTQSVNIDSTLTLTSVLDGTLTWGSYDNNTPWHEGGISNYNTPCTPVNTRVSVSDGIVTGIVTGQAVVYAKDEYGNREFFNVIVS